MTDARLVRTNEPGEIIALLDSLGVIIYTTDLQGRLTSLSGPVEELLGYSPAEVLAEGADALITPESLELVGRNLRRKLDGEVGLTSYEMAVIAKGGSRVRVQVTSAPLREDGAIIGVIGIGHLAGERGEAVIAPERVPVLTLRQLEVLRLLAEGLSTREIAARLTISPETARNHIRRILKSLGSHSRLEAVATARRLGLI